MSGGVDSSVAAALLHEQGYDVIGVTLQLWGKEVCTTAGTKLCCSVRDALDAKAVAKRLGIRHETLELADTFRTHVIDYFVDSYRDGLTPNPCIACNDHIKFGSLLEHADRLDAELIATGHYARVRYTSSNSTSIVAGGEGRSREGGPARGRVPRAPRLRSGQGSGRQPGPAIRLELAPPVATCRICAQATPRNV